MGRSGRLKYNDKKTTRYLDKVFEYFPLHLGEKFKYGQIQTNKSVELRGAIDLLCKAGVLHKAVYTNCSGVPLELGINEDKFKIYFSHYYTL